MRGKLFTQDYLGPPDGGIVATPAWREVGESDLDALEERLGAIFRSFPVAGTPQ